MGFRLGDPQGGFPVVDVADGNGEGVRRVGVGNGAPRQQHPDHHLNLFFGGVAGTDHGFLNQVGRIFGDAQPGLGGNQKGHAARLSQFKGRDGIEINESFLHRCLVGRVPGDCHGQTFVQLHQSLGEARPGTAADNTVGDVAETIVIGLDKAPAGIAQTRIQPKDSHLVTALSLA
jgi:hypothetical protein